MPLGWFLICLQKMFTEYELCITWDSGKEFGRLRRFLFCFLFILFSKRPFCFHYALKKKKNARELRLWGKERKKNPRVTEPG